MTLPPSPPPSTGPSLRRLGGVVLTVSFALRAWLVWRGGQFFWPDEDRFVAAQQAVRMLAAGRVHAAADLLFAQPDHLLFKLAGLVPAGLEAALGAPAWVPALCLAAVSTWVLWLVGQAARAAGATETESFVALLLAACTNSLFYYARHYFPYDLSLGFLLLAVITSLRGPPGRRTSLQVGAWTGVGFLVYNGYWSLAATILVFHGWRAFPHPRQMIGRAVGAAVGAGLPVLVVLVTGRILGHDLIAPAVRFAGTVYQGDLGRAWLFVPQYFWVTERGLAVLWAVAFGGTLVAGIRGAGRPVLLWPAFSLLLAALLILPSDLFHHFALSARHARVLAPFLCLATARALATLARPRCPSWLLPATLGLAGLQAAFNFSAPLLQVFPREFLQLARDHLAIARQHDLGPYAVLNCDFLHNPDWVKPTPSQGEVQLRRDHPFQFVPYLFEGYPAATRERFLRQDLSMRVVRLAAGGPPAAGYPAGLLEIMLRFPAGQFGLLPDPVVATGAAGRADLIYLQYEDAGHVRIGHDHFGGGSVLSAARPLDRGRPHRLLIGLGSFYPPGRSSRLVVAWDNETVFRQEAPFHPSAPDQIVIGQNFAGALTAVPLPAYDIVQFDKLALLTAPVTAADFSGAHRLLLFPADDLAAQPFLSSGRPGRGDLLFLRSEGGGFFRIGHDHAGTGATYSVPFRLAAGQPADFLITQQPVPGAAGWRRLGVSCNGRIVFNRVVFFHPARPGEVMIGANTAGSSVTASLPTMEIFHSSAKAVASPAGTPGRHPGAIRLQLRFAGPAPAGGAEPLLSTGQTGAGELLFLRYEDEQHLRVGCDHWGRAATLSESIPYDRNQPLDLVLSLGSLFPPGVPANRGGRLFVSVNGKTVLNQPATFYPAVPGSIVIGFNRIGASSARETLAADVLQYAEIPPEEILPLLGPP